MNTSTNLTLAKTHTQCIGSRIFSVVRARLGCATGAQVPIQQSLEGWAFQIALACCLTLVLGGCATSLPRVDRDAITSEAIAPSTTTTLGGIAQNSLPEPGLSGFRLMPLGTFALDARVQLAQRAEVSLDVQYYHFENDETGRYLLRALRDAADRGVRVRLLLDDLYTGGQDSFLLGFEAHKNVQVRLFNPFCCAREKGQAGRFLASIGDLKRVNHRMHNKMFLADGAMAVIGGRNVANEYYLRSETDNFIDLDAFVIGGIVPSMSALFDRYWNSDAVYPLASIAKTDKSRRELFELFEQQVSLAKTPEPMKLNSTDVLGYAPIGDDLSAGRLGLIWGSAYVFADHPDKPFEGAVDGDVLETSAAYNVLEAVGKAKSEIVASSPYFVPGLRGMEFLKAQRKKGVKITVMTNSLGSTDEPLVHNGYTRYREEMLANGISLYELSTTRVKDNKRLNLFGASLGRLHSKLFVVDRQFSFIGSMNLDPRSATINTEFGAVIDSPELAREIIRVIDIDRLQSAYKVRLAKSGKGVEWLGFHGDQEVVLDAEPDTSAWLRFQTWLLGLLVPEGQL